MPCREDKMTVEIKPLGLKCNLNCTYCYQREERKTEVLKPLNLEAMVKAAKGCKIAFFGGEALLNPKDVLEYFFKNGAKSIQTNGILVDADHIRMFKEYDAGIGVSIDGFGEMNAPRCNEALTQKALNNIKWMRDEGLRISIISIIHRMNANEKFKEFGLWLQDLGIPNVNLHFLQRGPSNIALGEREEVRFFLDLAEWLDANKGMRWNPFLDVRSKLEGKDALCFLNACDPLTNASVDSIERDGSVTGCGRCGGWLKADLKGNERQDCLAQTPQELGGCRGCRFLPLCTGGCPGEALDWRMHSAHCPTLKALFRFYEDKLLDSKFVAAPAPVGGGHGDTPHGDSHGDHYDESRKGN
jgi:uncharacterized protein